jgi:hypothetical protein
MDITEVGSESGLNSTRLVCGPMVGFCEVGNESPRSSEVGNQPIFHDGSWAKAFEKLALKCIPQDKGIVTTSLKVAFTDCHVGRYRLPPLFHL